MDLIPARFPAAWKRAAKNECPLNSRFRFGSAATCDQWRHARKSRPGNWIRDGKELIMLKTALLASAIATAALFGTSPTASAHSTRHWHAPHYVTPYFGVSKRIVRRKLQRRGFHRIRIRARNYRGFRVTACRDHRRFRMAVSRWGRIKWRERAGILRASTSPASPESPPPQQLRVLSVSANKIMR